MTQHHTPGTIRGEYLTVPEAAKVANLSERTIRRALTEHRLSGITVDGGRWLVSPADLDRFARVARRPKAPSGTKVGADAAGSGTNGTAPSGTTENPVPNGAALVVAAVAAQVEEMETALAAMVARIQSLEAEIADTREKLAQATAPRRRWWHRFTESPELSSGPLPGVVVPFPANTHADIPDAIKKAA